MNSIPKSEPLLPDFDSLISEQQRLFLLGKVGQIGEWFHFFATNTTSWSDYLYDFYELDKDFECSTLLEKSNFYSESEKEKMRRLIARVVSTQEEASDEFQINMEDGRIKCHTTTVFPILQGGKKLIGLYGVFQNIHSEKKINTENNKKQLPYSLILDRLPTELTVFDNQGRFLFSNQAAAKRNNNCNLSNENLLGIYDDSKNATLQDQSKCNELIETLTQQRSVSFEEKHFDRDGTERIYLRSIYPLFDKNCNAEFFISHGIDITSRKKNELDLRRMAYVAEKTNGIVMITDPKKKIIWINHSFEKILGYKSEEVIGLDPAAFLQGPETSKETIQEIAGSLKHTGTFSGEILNYTKSGEKIWLYLNIAAVYDDTGELINYVAVENDITLIKKAEQRLQKAIEKERELNHFKTQFVSLAPHQFRTPLATILSSIDLLDLKMESAELSSAFIKLFQRQKAIMAEETMRMTELMENILDIGRIDEGKIELSKKKLAFKQFMDAFVTSNREPNGQQRKLNYQFNAPDHIINIDEVLLRNVLRNIVSNAFKYSLGKSAPNLVVSFQDNSYLMTIIDYGIGIPENDQPFLFQSFFRASNAKVISGSGLGLMIAKKLIVLHGGNITIESKISRGCTVTIKLPV